MRENRYTSLRLIRLLADQEHHPSQLTTGTIVAVGVLEGWRGFGGRGKTR